MFLQRKTTVIFGKIMVRMFQNKWALWTQIPETV
jgi:hypothetical protein